MFFVTVIGSEAFGADHFSPDLKLCLNKITGHIYNDEFDEAGAVIDSLADSDCSRPFIFLSYSTLYQSQMMTAESEFLEKEFYSALDSLEFYSELMLETGQDSAMAYFLLGHNKAFRSLYDGRAGHTWSAIKKGLGARNAYSKAFDIDSTLYDIGLGLGSYRYWKSVKTKAINWTPLFKNEKKNGIELLRLAADSSEISQDAAVSSLIWIYISEKRYGEAIRLADEMRLKYPKGLTFVWALASAYYKFGDCPAAIEMYRTINRRVAGNPGNYFNYIESAFYIVKCLDEIKEFSPEVNLEKCELARMIEIGLIPEDTRKRQSKKIKTILKSCKSGNLEK
ncbi:MAG: bacterial transcriptional activator domain-containing protein [candidate division Zixibacteria bacterium]|nr:bacterial transcriptional activator domain-containing protein [candidate division Zixibacteria bacterium]